MAELTPRLTAFTDQFQAALAEQTGPGDFVRMRENFVSVQVCTSLDNDAATERMNLTSPSFVPGSSLRWELVADGENGPLPCDDNPDTHRHLIFTC